MVCIAKSTSKAQTANSALLYVPGAAHLSQRPASNNDSHSTTAGDSICTDDAHVASFDDLRGSRRYQTIWNSPKPKSTSPQVRQMVAAFFNDSQTLCRSSSGTSTTGAENSSCVETETDSSSSQGGPRPDPPPSVTPQPAAKDNNLAEIALHVTNTANAAKGVSHFSPPACFSNASRRRLLFGSETPLRTGARSGGGPSTRLQPVRSVHTSFRRPRSLRSDSCRSAVPVTDRMKRVRFGSDSDDDGDGSVVVQVREYELETLSSGSSKDFGGGDRHGGGRSDRAPLLQSYTEPATPVSSTDSQGENTPSRVTRVPTNYFRQSPPQLPSSFVSLHRGNEMRSSNHNIEQSETASSFRPNRPALEAPLEVAQPPPSWIQPARRRYPRSTLRPIGSSHQQGTSREVKSEFDATELSPSDGPAFEFVPEQPPQNGPYPSARWRQRISPAQSPETKWNSWKRRPAVDDWSGAAVRAPRVVTRAPPEEPLGVLRPRVGGSSLTRPKLPRQATDAAEFLSPQTSSQLRHYPPPTGQRLCVLRCEFMCTM
eukprot:Blabericola_migrator_1__10649@NODE_606_length_7355_cov_27_739572_g439_i0_p2_GENE_NODE_606_length_7355_cov_27_739572_g439_i0NODE_606_length_7355_cov_27_739572_g439_i0_p2_ORF_typecomplete_len542_score36_33_NODE_606_length_7355_cov_27_739572_g439_i08492474